jgi:hypothetical protein
VSDAHLRALERRFRETRSLADEVAWLRAVMQSGRVDAGTVERAAILGHPASRALLGKPPHASHGWRVIAEAIHALGHEASVRAAIAALAPVLMVGRTLGSEQDWIARAERVRDSLEAWLARPDTDNAYLPRAVARDQFPHDGRLGDRLLDPTRPHFELAQRAASLLPIPERLRDEEADAEPEVLAQIMAYARSLGSQPLEQFLDQAAFLAIDPEMIRQALVDDLVPWLFGVGDPALTRTKASPWFVRGCAPQRPSLPRP